MAQRGGPWPASVVSRACNSACTADLLAPGNAVEVEHPLGEPRRSLEMPRDVLILRADSLDLHRIDGQQRADREGPLSPALEPKSRTWSGIRRQGLREAAQSL